MFSPVRVSILFLAAAATAGAASVSSAQQSVRPLTMDETIRAASSIFIGRVTDSRSRWGTPARKWIATDITFQVEDVLLPNGSIQKGRAVVLTYPGGTIDGKTQAMAGQVVPVTGQRYAMMLGADYDQPGTHPEAGGAGLGLFKIVQGKKGGLFYVADAQGSPVCRASDGRIIRASEARPEDRKGLGVSPEHFAQWVRDTAAKGKPKSGTRPTRT
jgi:hypothetical protein